MKTISLIMAMEEEARGLIQALKLERFSPGPFYDKQPFHFYQAVYKSQLKITLTLLGKDKRFGVDNIGTEPAAVAAFATVSLFKPDFLVSVGTAGSFSEAGATVGKVYLSHKAFYYHDHRIPIAGWDKYGNGSYASLDMTKLAGELGLALGDVSSGNSLDFTPKDIETMKRNGAVLKEMEACAVAWVAHITQTPMFAIKSVTNLIDTNPDSAGEFKKNFAVAVSALTEKTLAVIERISAED